LVPPLFALPWAGLGGGGGAILDGPGPLIGLCGRGDWKEKID